MSDAVGENNERQATLEPLLAALEHIAVRGNLLLLVTDHAHRARIMKAMTELELVEWNTGIRKYEMTSYGRQCLAEYRRKQN
jgi:predicted transcriptional regulator